MGASAPHHFFFPFRSNPSEKFFKPIKTGPEFFSPTLRDYPESSRRCLEKIVG
jgi:hypothetical protein